MFTKSLQFKETENRRRGTATKAQTNRAHSQYRCEEKANAKSRPFSKLSEKAGVLLKHLISTFYYYGRPPSTSLASHTQPAGLISPATPDIITLWLPLLPSYHANSIGLTFSFVICTLATALPMAI